MQQLTKNKRTNKDRLLNVILGIVFILSPFCGIACAVWATGDIENYVEPFKFSLIFGGIGVVLSLLVSSRLKPTVVRVNRHLKDYSQLKVFLAMGFLGIFLLIGVKVNSSSTAFKKTYETQITNKTERENRFMFPGYYKLHFVINNRPVEIKCHRKIWDKENIGETLSLNFYKSKIGFDYWKLNEE